MKLAIRIFALSVVFAGVAAASFSSSTRALLRHQSATASMPIPGCVPGLPTCPASIAGQ